MKRENITLLASLSVGVVAVGIILNVFIKTIFPVIAPFLIALTIALACDMPAEVVSLKTRIPKSRVRLALAILSAIALSLSFSAFVFFAVNFLINVISGLVSGGGIDKISEFLGSMTGIFGDAFPDKLALGMGESLKAALTEILSKLGSSLTSLVGGIPDVMLFLLVTLISLVYFSLDLDRVKLLFRRILPDWLVELLSRLKLKVFTVGRKYVVSYIVILAVTYVTVLSGLLLLRVERAALVALFIAVLDILPVLGVGTVLIPWSVVAFAMGNTLLGVGLILLFVVNTIIRQIVEPRLVGRTLSLHPVMTLMMIYIGYALYGGVGLVVMPLFMVIFVSLFKKDDATEIG